MKPKAIIVDVDGTVAHRGTRDAYDMATVSNDTPDLIVWGVVKAVYVAYGYTLIFTSGRDETARDDTSDWLKNEFGAVNFHLLMRAEGDNRPDHEIKKEMLDNSILPLYDVFCVFDDRNKVVKMWREQGLKVFQVADGDF